MKAKKKTKYYSNDCYFDFQEPVMCIKKDYQFFPHNGCSRVNCILVILK